MGIGRIFGRRIVAVLGALVFVLFGVSVPAATAYNGGATKANPVVIPVAPPGIFTVDTTGLSSTGSAANSCSIGQCWQNVGWYSWTPADSGTVAIRATTITSGYDTTLEVWTGAGAGTLVTQNDDSYGLDAMVTFAYGAGQTYVIGWGGYNADDVGMSQGLSIADVPAAPTNVVATAGNASASLSWNHPDPIRQAVESYSVYTYIDGVQQGPPNTVNGSPPVRTYTKTGLTNDVAYTFRVLATNDLGASPLSDPSGLTSPTSSPAAPGVPTVSSVTAGNGQITVGVSPTAGGTPSSYTVTASPGGATCSVTPPATTCAVPGLSNGTSYSFTATATNPSGTSAASTPSGSVTPGSPGVPEISSVTVGDGQVTVGVSPTAGGTPSSYTVVASPGPAQCMVTPPATSCTMSGLTDGVSYTFSATATNGAGTSGSSTPSAPVVVGATAPDAPSNVTAVIVGKTATVAFDAAVANGSDVTQYTVTASEGAGQCVVSAPFTAALQCSIGGLVRGVTYTFSVTATNAVGVSPAGVSNAVSTADPLPTVGNRPWAVNPGTGLPGRVRGGAAVPLLTEEQVEAGVGLTALTPGVCVVRDSRVFTIGRGMCRVRVAAAGQAGSVVGMRVVRGRSAAAAPGQAGLSLAGRLLFRPDSARLTRAHQRVLSRVAGRWGDGEALVIGHAHNAGGGNADFGLSRKRAQNVVDRLRQLGLDQVTLLTHPVGSVQNGNKASVNRRVDIYTM